MTDDPTEQTRRQMLESGQTYADMRKASKRWTTEEMRKEFEVIGFMAPFVAVRRRADAVRGSLEFTHHPRVYFGWVPHDE
jgi:hypothetical protein